jgi:hypothetical protein
VKPNTGEMKINRLARKREWRARFTQDKERKGAYTTKHFHVSYCSLYNENVISKQL